MKSKKLFLMILLIIISVSVFARYNDNCVKVATAVASNVAFAQSDIGQAIAVATAIAKAGDVTAISHVVASIKSAGSSLARVYALAVAIAYAVDIHLCDELKKQLKIAGIELETAIAATMGYAIATNNPEDLRKVNDGLQSAADNLRESIKLLK